ncbi:MAG: hypothetical protein HZT43_02575 [Exiguobacterium profundum]|nr:MAG: hypothetical protein HZT43_02575 [Exiguobacterium profundum]
MNLTEDDLLFYRVEAAGLASVISAVAGFKDAPSQLVKGLWQLGVLPSGRIVILAFEAAALTGETIVPTLRQDAQGQDVTILVPAIPSAAAKRLREAGFHVIETVSVMAPLAGGFGVAIDPATLSPPPDPSSLRVRSASAEVEWLGRSVVLSHQLFPVFQRLLAKAKTRDQVASGPEVEGTTGREAKDLIRELRAAFVAASARQKPRRFSCSLAAGAIASAFLHRASRSTTDRRPPNPHQIPTPFPPARRPHPAPWAHQKR